MPRQSQTAPAQVVAVDVSQATGPPLVSLDAAIFREVRVALKVTLGEVSMTVDELLALSSGTTLKLDRQLNEPVELHLNGALVGRGQIVAVDDNFAIRLTEVAPVK